jgi:hypothetical protein
MKTIKIMHAVVLLCVLCSCASFNSADNPLKAAERTAAILSNAPSALEAVLDSFKKADIVFIGGTSHRLLNEVLFTAENLQRFYDAGVRYILVEGAGGRKDDSPLYSDEELLDRGIMLFYPWEYVGVRYTSCDWGDEKDYSYETYRINAGKSEKDAIKKIGLEFGRLDVIPGTMDNWELLNYRDEYMANMAFKYIDNAAPGEKFLVLAGGSHGITGMAGPAYNWKPLGAYLKEKYKNNFVSYFYFTLEELITDYPRDSSMGEFYQGIFQSEEWQGIPNTPKLVTPKQTVHMVDLLSVQYEAPFDKYIVDKSGIKGIMYSYVLFKPDVLQQIITQTRQYESGIRLLSGEGPINYEDADTYYMISDFLINVYYLRLSFGEYFPYDFWNPQMPLNEALSILESVVLAPGADPQDYLRFPVPAVEAMRDYHDNIEYFASLRSIELMQAEGSGTAALERVFQMSQPYMQKAQELFPYELWTDYWYAKMYSMFDDYGKAYPYLQTLLDNSLTYSMQIYPEVLELGAHTAERLGEQSAEYQARLDGLTNEFDIDTSLFNLFLD